VANFVEVFLAKEGHPGVVGLNLLEKIQFPNLPSLYGAMLAGVNAVLVSAGIPRAVPGVLDHFAAGRGAEPVLDATDADPTAPVKLRFESADYFATPARELKRPQFLAIVSSATLAIMLAKKSAGRAISVIRAKVSGVPTVRSATVAQGNLSTTSCAKAAPLPTRRDGNVCATLCWPTWIWGNASPRKSSFPRSPRAAMRPTWRAF
jgi:hypothetical protein